jgi:O-antigen/teichoic acid export membrane protein
LIKKIISKGIGHFSLAMIVLGAGCFFITNILLKEILTKENYGQYSIVITYLSIMYLFGLLGLEQIFLRYSNFSENNTILTQKFQIQLIIKVILVTSTIGSIYFYFYFLKKIPINPILLYAATLSMVALMFLYNIFRLNSNFVFAQFIANFWKIILLILSGILFIYKISSIELLLNILMCVIIFTFLFSLFFFFRKIDFVYNNLVSKRDILITSLQFFISITSFSLITFGDRFIIENKFGVEEFGNYFYLTNFFLAPFSILQNYVGFKQLIFFKNNFKIEIFNSFNKKILVLGAFLGLVLFIIPQILMFFKILNFEFNNYLVVIILLLFLGIIRLYSASITSAFEAKTNVYSLQKANITFIILSFIIIMFVILFCKTLELIIASIILIWLIRSLIFKHLLFKQIMSEDKN